MPVTPVPVPKQSAPKACGAQDKPWEWCPAGGPGEIHLTPVSHTCFYDVCFQPQSQTKPLCSAWPVICIGFLSASLGILQSA